MKRVIKAFFILLFIITALIAGYSNYWLYTNKTNPIYISIKEGVDDSRFTTIAGDAILTHEGASDLDPIQALAQLNESSPNISQVGHSDVEGAVVAETIDYSGQSLDNISSPRDIEVIRQSSEEPLYLRGHLIVPSAGIEERIMEGLGSAALTYGVGTMNPSTHPSQYGTFALAGHNFGDWDYGTGLSKLQKYGSSLVGHKAYVTYGDFVYEYTFVDVNQMFRDYSMPYTETDWNTRDLSGVTPQFTDDYQVLSGSQALRPDDYYVNYDVNPNANYNYGKILTLYTCHVLPPDYRFSYDRIVARGIQTDVYTFDNLPEDVKPYFYAKESSVSNDSNWIPSWSGPLTAYAQSEYTFTNKALPNINKEAMADPVLIEGAEGVEGWINQQLRRNPRFMERVAQGSTAVSVVSLVVVVALPTDKKRGE